MVARSSALRIGTAHWNELSKISTPTESMGRRFSTTPMAARRASSILRPSMEDDLSMISTTAVPSGERGGASLAGRVRSSGVFGLALLIDVDVVLAGDPDQPAALLHVVFQSGFRRRRDGLHVPVVDHHELEIVELRGYAAGACCTSNWLACSARRMCSSLAADRGRPAGRAGCAASPHLRSALLPVPGGDTGPPGRWRPPRSRWPAARR